MKVVIIDDDKLVSMSLKMILENGTDIEVAAVGEDGREAVSLYKKYSPDILLLDIRMQYMTGLEAARNVLAAYPDAKILFLTTFSDDEYIIEALEIGVKGYLLKQDYEGWFRQSVQQRPDRLSLAEKLSISCRDCLAEQPLMIMRHRESHRKNTK